MDLGMIVNPDHMSQAARRRHAHAARGARLLRRDLAARLDGPGQLAAAVEARRHGVPRPLERRRATSRSGRSTARADAVRVRLGLRRRPRRPLAPARRRARAAITYPFKSYDGKVTFDRQKTGERTFDYAKEGVAHYGLYADWFEDLRRVGGDAMADDMWDGAEAYLADVGARRAASRTPRCRVPRRRDHARAGRGRCASATTGGRCCARAGQPQQRDARVELVREGQAQPHAPRTSRCSSADGQGRARRQHRASAGARRAAQARAAARAGSGIEVRHTRRAAWVHFVRKGRVARGRPSRRRTSRCGRKALRARCAGCVRAQGDAAAPRRSCRAPRRGGVGRGGSPAARSRARTNRQLNAALALLCSLQVQAPG